MDPVAALQPRHRLPLRLPRAWPACAASLLREGACWLHAGGPGGWGGDLLALPGGPRLEARWNGTGFQSAGIGEGGPWRALAAAVAGSPHPWVGAATFELASSEAGLPFQAPPPGTLGMAWQGALEVIYASMGQVELWSWGEPAPDPAALEARLGQTCALGRPEVSPLSSGWSRKAHLEAVARVQHAIREGALYVANLCVPFQAAFKGDPVTFALARFRAAKPPFGAFLPLGDTLLVCLSMERLVAKNGSHVWCEPIKGSAELTGEGPRDAEAGARLLADPKERAEHTMIVDLVRNDLGRVARTGTVEVAALLERRLYPTVQHLVSRVEAELDPAAGLADLLRALLPGGSVTGAPKHAVCGHLAQAELAPRGFYCGALGWIGPGGRCLDLALPIRTAQLQGDQLTYWAGGGITRRSEPEKEWDELLLKTRVLGF